jgi:hypothetical protein
VRVARSPENWVVRFIRNRHFGHVGLAEDYCSGGLQPADYVCIRSWHVVQEHCRAIRRAYSFSIDRVLDGDRETVQWVGNCAVGQLKIFRARAIENIRRYRHDRVQRRIYLFDPMEVSFDNFNARDFSRRD